MKSSSFPGAGPATCNESSNRDGGLVIRIRLGVFVGCLLLSVQSTRALEDASGTPGKSVQPVGKRTYLGTIWDNTGSTVNTEVLQSNLVVPNVFTGDLRDLPKVQPWQPGDPIFEGPSRRITNPEALTGPPEQPGEGQRDPLLDLQENAARNSAVLVPGLNFGGLGFSGVAPPDTVGEIGPQYYIQMTNGSTGSPFTIFDKTTGSVVAGPSILSSLWTAGGACTSSIGDPIVLFDQLASRWLMAEIAGAGNHLCVYVSRTSDPLAGGWYNYDFAVPQFPDYPKYGVWPDAYYVSSNESSPRAYALDRSQMLAGLPATFLRLTASSLAGFGFQTLIPSDLDGTTAAPAGTPNFFMRHRDDEAHNVGSNDPTRDFLEIWEFHVDFVTPANSTFSLATTIPVTEFESELCGLFSFDCFPQPGTARRLDTLREVVMWRLQYRNFSTHETLVGVFVTDVDGGAADHGGLRWFELRRVGAGVWTLFQEGTYAPDADHRWMGSIAMDGSGNMAVGYSVSSSATFPGIRYTGRAAGDAAGTMTAGELTAMNGSGSQTITSRWGDYSSINVDPVDDCTFWYTNEYVPANGFWTTRIASFRFADPTCVDATPPDCGNNAREVGEDCDGTDDAFCPGECQANCTCLPPICGDDTVNQPSEQCDETDDAACPGQCRVDCTCPPPPPTSCLLTNVDFETGTLAGWAQINSGSGFWVINDGTLIPTSGDGPLGPCGDSFEAMVDQGGPGVHTLYQDLTIPGTVTTATLNWTDMIRNHNGAFSDPNQEFRVEIWDPNTNAVLASLFSTDPGDLALQNCTARSADISAFIGQTVRIAFTEEDGLFFFNVHVDDVRIDLGGGQIFASDPQGRNLGTVDPDTGLFTVIGPFTGAAGNVTEIEWDPTGTTLYATTGGGNSTIHTVDPTSGTILTTVVHPFGALSGLEFDAAGNLLGTEVVSGDLVSVNPATGVLTPIGPTFAGGNVGGLAFDVGFTTLFGITSGGAAVPPTLLNVNPATGLATSIAVVSVAVEMSSLEFTSCGQLVAGGADGILYEIHTTTGVAIAVGPLVNAGKVSGLSVKPGGMLPAIQPPLAEDSLATPCTTDADCAGTSFCLDGRCYVHKNRYISIHPNNPGETVKLQVTLTASLPHPGLVGTSWWVLPPDAVVPGSRPRPLLGPGECLAVLGPEADAAEIDWDAAGCSTLHITGCPIEPTSEYDVRAVGTLSASPAVMVPTAPLPTNGRFWCDVAGDNLGGMGWQPPQGTTNINDVFAILETFKGGQVVAPTAIMLRLTWADLQPGDINTVVNIADVQACILAFNQSIDFGVYPFGPADADGCCEPGCHD